MYRHYPDELISKPRTGAPTRILFADVAEVKETTAIWSAGRYANRIPAVEFVLMSGQISVITLDFRSHDEILRKIREMVSEHDTPRRGAEGSS
jgi:hypothetical protein